MLEVSKWYPTLPRSSQRRRGSKNIINRNGLRVSPWMVPLRIGMGWVVPKNEPLKAVVELV